MTTIINHDLRVVDGRTLYMPPYAGGQDGWGNLALPDVGVSDAVQKYPIGTKYVEGDRTFRYAHANPSGGTITPGRLVCNMNTVQERAGASWDVNGVVGDTVVYINAMVNNIDLNEFAGGYLLYAGADGLSNMIPIVSNTAATTGDGPSTIVLGMPLTGAATAGVTGSTLTGSIFGNVLQMSVGAGTGYQSAVGLPLMEITQDYYAWIQTWGPCIIVGVAATGDTDDERTVIVNQDGCIKIASMGTVDSQRAGFIATTTWYNTGAVSSNFIILQLFP